MEDGKLTLEILRQLMDTINEYDKIPPDHWQTVVECVCGNSTTYINNAPICRCPECGRKLELW